ncbi:MAG: hypothetical protein L3K10_01640 [Thermoplasmata archaeon]|nr:hypothetical protein [Thermoplasmata archaeon]
MAAVATLLGLLLVVTFIANFLTTIVPNQMQVNDLNHVIAVENEFSRLSALLSAAGEDGGTGIQVVQPLSLGSDGVAPWTAPDGSAVGSGRFWTNLTVSYGLLGESVYSPPLGSPQGGPQLPAGCSFTTLAHVGIACTLALSKLAYNFSGNAKAFTITSTLATGLYALNYSTNHSTISIAATGGAKVDVAIYGSNDSVTLSVLGGSAVNVTVVGNHDYLNLGPTGTAGVVVRSFGDSDSVYDASTGVGSLLVISYGNGDSITANATGAAANVAYVTGFNATNPVSPLCPYDNVSRTEALHGTGPLASYNAYYNDTAYTGTLSASPWTIHAAAVAQTMCPFFSRQAVPIKGPSLQGAGLTVHLFNTYSPSGEVAYDEGAVVYAQFGAYPVIIDPPAISLTRPGGVGTAVTQASLWFPYFSNVVGSASGTGTETLNLRLLQSSNPSLTNNTSVAFSLNPAVPITITFHTPYAEAWDQYLNGNLQYAGLWSCLPFSICTGTYSPGGSLGTVTLTIPTVALQQLTVGNSVFSVGLS